MKITARKRVGVETCSFALLATFALALGLAPSAQAARYWTGNSSSQFTASGNWDGTTGRRYFYANKLKGSARQWMWLGEDVTESSNSGLCFATVPSSGYWHFRSNAKNSIHTYNNSAGKAYDTGWVAIGYKGDNSKVRLHAINITTRNLTIGGDTSLGGSSDLKYDMTGYLTIDDLNDDGTEVWGTPNITAATCDFYKGSLYATNANLTCSGNMQLLNFTAEKSGGDWTVNGDLIVGAKSGASATFTQKSGTTTVSSGKWTKSTVGNGTLNLNGGTFVTKFVTDDSAGSSMTVNFNGGTLKANAANGSGLLGHRSGNGLFVNVDAGGGTIDTGAFNITVAVPINAVANTAGAFTVTGGGSATFNGAVNLGGGLTVTGGTAATFSAMGEVAGGFTLGDNSTLHWFDQDGIVSNYTFTALNIGAGSTLYLDADATGCDAFVASATNISATAENPATIELVFSAVPAAGRKFALFETDNAAKFNVNPKLGALTLPHAVAVEDGMLTLTITAEDYTWNGTGTNWGDAGAWDMNSAAADWSDGNNAIFATANATATLAAAASAAEVRFTADAAVTGSATLTVPSVSVVSDVSSTISAPTAGALEKTGAGTLTLGSSRTAQTTVAEGTLAMADGATVDPAKLTLGTNPAKPVTFDYGGQTLTGNPADCTATGMNVTLTNGVFEYASTIWYGNTSNPAALTVAADATLQSGDHFTLVPSGEMTVNVAGGTMKSTKNANNWIMQASLNGRLDINVTGGGLLEFGGETYMLTCRDTVDGSTAYESPKMNMRVVDSTVSVKNGKSIRFGFDGGNKNPQCPTLVFAATNSVIDIGYAFYIGNNAVGEYTAGSYTADFENCIITARQVTVYQDRPLNAVRFNNTRFVVNQASDWTLETAAAFETMGDGGTAIKPMTIDAGGLVLDTNGKNCGLKADLQGSGALTKTGSGKLTIFYSQSSSAGLICEAGETFLNAGLTVARPVTVKNGATFTAGATEQSTLSSLTFEAGSTLNIDTPTVGVTPMSVATLTLPSSGTVALKKNGGAFAKGLYPIVEKVGITAADAASLVPETSNLPYEWTVQGNTLVLAVDMGLTGFVWTGLAGDGKMSTDGNWLNGVAPSVAGTDLDFSGVAVATTVNGDIDVTLGAVTMGEGVITFTGDKMRATSFSDTTKVAVGENATVTIDGDLMFTDANGEKYAVYKVNEGGKFVVTGKLGLAAGSGCSMRSQANPGTGLVVAGSLVNDGSAYIYVTLDNNSVTHKWVIGPGGITGTVVDKGMWLNSNNKVNPEFQPLTNDFTVTLWTCLRENAKSWTYNTTGLDGLGHTITLDAGFSDKGDPLYIKGTGKVVVNHVSKSFGGNNAYSGVVEVGDTATLAINAGKKLTSGKISFAAGTTLEVPSTGVEMGEIAFSGEGAVTLKVSDEPLADGDYSLVRSTGNLPANVATAFDVVIQSESPYVLYTPDNRELKLLVGNATPTTRVWIGTAGDGKMSTAGNWVGGVPSAGAALCIPSTAATIDNDIDGFAPASITFGYGSGVVTISGNPITGVVAITNLSTTASHTINAPVYFAGDIQVKQAAMAETDDLAKAHVTFAGGAYAAPGCAIENGNSTAVYSRCMFGKYYLANVANNLWSATVQGSSKRLCVADNSTLYIPYAGVLTELYIGNGSKVDVGEMANTTGRIGYRNYGEMVVTNMTITGSGDRFVSYNQGTNTLGVFKFDSVTNSMTDNWFCLYDKNAAASHVFYIGEGGLNFANASGSAYCLGLNKDGNSETIRPWYSDFTIAGRGDSTAALVLRRSVEFCTDDESGIGRTITIDAVTRGNGAAPAITVSGSGTLRVNKAASNDDHPTVTVTNTATLALKPGASLGTGDTTVCNGAALEVSGSGTVTLGNLTLSDGATLKFNFTERRTAPVLDLTDKTVTFGSETNITVSVKGDVRPGYGSDGKYFLTQGGKFSELTNENITSVDCASWVRSVGIESGNLYASIKPIGTTFIVK